MEINVQFPNRERNGGIKSAEKNWDARKEKVGEGLNENKKKSISMEHVCVFVCMPKNFCVCFDCSPLPVIYILCFPMMCSLFPIADNSRFLFHRSPEQQQQTVLIFARLPFHLVSEPLNSNNNSTIISRPRTTKTSNFQLNIRQNRHGCRSSYLENTPWWMHANEKARAQMRHEQKEIWMQKREKHKKRPATQRENYLLWKKKGNTEISCGRYGSARRTRNRFVFIFIV